MGKDDDTHRHKKHKKKQKKHKKYSSDSDEEREASSSKKYESSHVDDKYKSTKTQLKDHRSDSERKKHDNDRTHGHSTFDDSRSHHSQSKRDHKSKKSYDRRDEYKHDQSERKSKIEDFRNHGGYDEYVRTRSRSWSPRRDSRTETDKRRDSSEHEDDSDYRKIIPDYEFQWEDHRYILDKVFFQEEDVIRRGTPRYDDFWAFLAKYITFQKKKAARSQGNQHGTNSGQGVKYDLPLSYDKRYRINLALPKKEFDYLLSKYRPRRPPDGEAMTVPRLKQFQLIVLHYLDFEQKQKFAKLQKIKKDQQNLPMYKYQEEVVETLRKNQVVVVAGDTGCGKSTQVPQYLLRAGFDNIACTQPRRIACISLARRVAYETLNEYGSEVAHQVRFEKSRTRHTRILFLTEGLLLRQMGSDPLLHQYSVIVIDEVHERHIHTDFLLGVIKCVLKQRPDLKLVLMSATINIDLFSSYFDDASVVKVPGRLFPIELQYCPLDPSEKTSRTERLDPSPYIRILQSIDHKYPSTERGDVLMFLSGMAEIMAVVEAAKMYAHKTQRWIILPLHSALSVAEQDKVFDVAPEGVRKCIVSTNIAETSVTIDGVRFVVDSGKVKEMSYDSKYKLQRLQEFWISRASAEQRKGRAGRTGPGHCFRLYAEKEYQEFQPYSTPEIHRVTLDGLVLQMIHMGMPDARRFPFIEPPSMTTLETSIAFLKDQGAITARDEVLTPLGEMLAQLPVDVVVGKMLIMASLFDMVEPVLCISAALSVQSPFTARAHQDKDAMSARKPLESDHGDPLTLLNAYDEWVQMKAQGDDTRRWCRRRALEEQRFYEMTKLKNQFKDCLQDYAMVDDDRELREHMTAAERRQKTVERKRLKQLRNEQQRKTKRRKVLKLEEHDMEFTTADGTMEKDDPEEELESSIKDLEFRLTEDLDQLQESSNRSRSLSLGDILLLKVILCSGLYPQLAIADQHNNYKPESEQIFHTKTKGFVVLHPTSIFSYQPELLELPDNSDTTRQQDLKGFISSKHQLLAFVSLLETTKPYIVGSMRVPALQTLLLFSNEIDTNADCTRLVFDGWLEVTIADSEDSAETVISNVLQLRAAWDTLIALKLKVGNDRSGVGMGEERHRMYKLKALLGRKLSEFLSSEVRYGLRRILAAEQKDLYVGPQAGSGSEVLSGMMEAGGEMHPIKGGTQVTPFLTVNCLASSADDGGYMSYLQQHWTCTQCGESRVVTMAEKLHHQQICHTRAATAKPDNVPEEKEDDGLGRLRKPYHCDTCKADFTFTTAETLKHRRSCTGKAEENS